MDGGCDEKDGDDKDDDDVTLTLDVDADDAEALSLCVADGNRTFSWPILSKSMYSIGLKYVSIIALNVALSVT